MVVPGSSAGANPAGFPWWQYNRDTRILNRIQREERHQGFPTCCGGHILMGKGDGSFSLWFCSLLSTHLHPTLCLPDPIWSALLCFGRSETPNCGGKLGRLINEFFAAHIQDLTSLNPRAQRHRILPMRQLGTKIINTTMMFAKLVHHENRLFGPAHIAHQTNLH